MISDKGTSNLLRRRASASIAGALLIIAAAGVLGLANAQSAYACDPNVHCYAVVHYEYHGTGGYATLVAMPLTSYNPCGFPVVASLWVGTGDDPSFSHFVEQGIMYGTYPPQDRTCHGVHWYWASRRACCGFDYHYSTLSTSLNTNYGVKTIYEGNNVWGLYRNGTRYNQSLNQACCSYDLEAGLEVATFPPFDADAGAGAFQKRSLSGTSSYDWPGSVQVYGAGLSAGWNSYGKAAWFSAHRQ